MSLLRKLAGQTAVYGLPSILGRFLNYLLVPIHLSQFSPDVYGVITELYSYVAFFVVLLTYGMETAFFKFSISHEREKVYSNALGSILITTTAFLLLGLLLSGTIASALDYQDHPEYIIWFALILGLDAVSAIPMARLRQENKAIKFAVVNLGSIAVTILVNLLFIGYCMPHYRAGQSNWFINAIYNPELGVGYVFVATLAASAFKCLLMYAEIIRIKLRFEFQLMKEMLAYALPLLVAGLAGIINETFSRGFFKYFLEPRIGHQAAMYQLGIFGAVYKLSILITLFIQAYRYAAEPFFFQQSKEGGGGNALYVQMMNIFSFIVFGMFLVVTLFIDVFKLFLNNEEYYVGLHIVPILLLANAFLGISYNLSVWYKLSGKTMYGAYISIAGAIVTMGLNWILIPTMGYEGAAWSTLACYGTLMVLSYLLGRLFYPIPYQVGKNLGFLALALGLFFIDHYFVPASGALGYVINILLLFIFAGTFLLVEKPKAIFKRA
ncbi:MAG: polysaccharide biosynthesis C-terminal domain-containing protein [Bacteroidota bacterium]